VKRSSADKVPWYRDRWPWLLMAPPAASLVLGIAMWTLAVRSDDGLVHTDYYRRGLTINRKLAHAPVDPAPPSRAVVRIGDDGEVRVRVGSDLYDRASPPTLRLTLRDATASGPARVVVLARDASGDYVGRLSDRPLGRWVVTLESDAWRLPTTTVPAHAREIRLGDGAEGA
jgi:hypothetical protein